MIIFTKHAPSSIHGFPVCQIQRYFSYSSLPQTCNLMIRFHFHRSNFSPTWQPCPLDTSLPSSAPPRHVPHRINNLPKLQATRCSLSSLALLPALSIPCCRDEAPRRGRWTDSHTTAKGERPSTTTSVIYTCMFVVHFIPEEYFCKFMEAVNFKLIIYEFSVLLFAAQQICIFFLNPFSEFTYKKLLNRSF